MVNIIDMEDIRHLNLFSKVTGINTRYCFNYNEAIFFCVPQRLISKAVGENEKNVKQISSIVKRKIKIIPNPTDISDAKKFISSIVSPVTFQNLEIKEDEIILTAGSQSKAALIGRNKRRLLEMQKIVRNFFKKDFKII